MKAFNEKIILRNLAVDPSGGNRDLIAAIETPVTVFVTGSVVLAELFDLNEDPIPNPVNTDLKGNVVFKVENGIYDIVGAAGTQDETRWDQVEISSASAQGDPTSVKYYTLAEAVVLPGAFEGQVIQITDRADGQFFYSRSGTPNGFDIVECTGSISQFVLRLISNDRAIAKQFGCVMNGVTDDTNAAQRLLDYARGQAIDAVFADGTMLYTTITNNGVKITGNAFFSKQNGSDAGVIMEGLNPVIEKIKFISQSGSGQPNLDIKFADGCVNPTVRFCEFEGYIYSAIGSADDPSVSGGDFPYTVNVKNASIHNNIFKGYTRPLYLYCMDGYTIDGNRFSDCDFDAIRIREVIGDGLIVNNIFTDIGDTTVGDEQTRDAIDTAWSGKNLIISNNIIKNCAYGGIDVKGVSTQAAGYGSSDIIISNNYVENTHISGIILTGDGRFMVNNNIVTRCNNSDSTVSEGGIKVKTGVKHVTITNNICTFNKGRGINCEAFDYFDISHNTCVNNKDSGIALGGGMNYGSVKSNRCVMDASDEYPNQQLYGIQFTGNGLSEKTIHVEGNICKDNTSAQMNFAGSSFYQNMIASWKSNYEEGPNAYGGSSGFARFANKEPRVRWFNGTLPSGTAGTFEIGDILYYTNPTPGASVGLVYTSSGWKGFGTIAS